jgi:hypothetical protein
MPLAAMAWFVYPKKSDQGVTTGGRTLWTNHEVGSSNLSGRATFLEGLPMAIDIEELTRKSSAFLGTSASHL